MDYILPESLTEDDKVCIVNYLTGKFKTDSFKKLYAIFGDEIFLFLSVFEGETVEVPDLTTTNRVKEYSKIYVYVMRHGLTEDTIKAAATRFKKKPSEIEIIIGRVSRELDKVVVEDALRKEGEPIYKRGKRQIGPLSPYRKGKPFTFPWERKGGSNGS